MPEPDPLLTRETLIIRLRDPEDAASWAEFAEIYTPLFYGFCVKRGLNHADAADVVQEVMRGVSRAMPGFQYDPEKGRFKGWLFTAVRNAISAHFRKASRRPVTPGETRLLSIVEAEPDEREKLDWEHDYQRQLLGWAMDQIRDEFGENVWKAFEQTALRGRDPSELAEELGMSNNAIAAAKYRVTLRLKEKAQSVDAEQWEGEMIARAAGS